MARMVKNMTVADVSSATASASLNVAEMETASWWVLGTFVGTVILEISPDDVTWIVSGSSATVPIAFTIPAHARFARIDVSSYTSGDFESTVTAIDTDQ